MQMRADEETLTTCGTVFVALLCVNVMGVLGGLLWYAVALGALLIERLVYRDTLARHDMGRRAEWRVAVSSAAVVAVFIFSALVWAMDPRSWVMSGSVAMLFICVLNSSHFGAVSRLVGRATLAPSLLGGALIPIVSASVQPQHDWIGAGMMSALGAVAVSLILRHQQAKAAVERQMKATLAELALERHKAEEASLVLQLAVRAASGAVWRIDIASRAIWTSPEYEALLGHDTYEDIVAGRPSWLSEEDYPRYDALRAELRGHGDRVVFECRMRPGDGPQRWLHTVMQAHAADDGKLRWVVGLTREITDQKVMEARFLEATRQAEGVVNEKRALFASIASGLSLSEASADRPPSPPRPADREGDSINELFERFVRVVEEIDVRDAALTRAVDAIQSARLAAEAANVSKSRFLANMSHELRTPMNAIIGYTEILYEDAEDAADAGRREDLSRILGAARHLLELINEVLDLSKIEAGALTLALEDQTIADIAAEALALVKPIAEKNANMLVVELAADLGRARLDGMRLRQCLVNVLSNACKFTHEGRVTFTAARRRIGASDWLCFDVSDTGIGMSETQMAHLFQPFAQGDETITRRFGGTGLGLSISKRLIEMMGGVITVDSAPGVGSRFTMRIPLKAMAQAGEEVAASRPAGATGPVALSIEDSPDARAIIARTLEPLGFDVVGASSRAQGRLLAESLHPAVILLDLDLPDGNGLELLAALRQSPRTADIPVVVLSIDDRREPSIAAGACQHLVKPVARDVLAATVLQFARLPAVAGAAPTLAAPPAAVEAGGAR
jgi:signal transduction histidine kinase/CheY-like chemotaxis protein